MAADGSPTPTYHDALALDIHTLSLLLQRNYHQHRRCIYFRRLSIALSAVRRLPSFNEVNGWIEEFKPLVRLLHDETKGIERNGRQKEEHWTLQHTTDNDGIKIISENDGDKVKVQHQLQHLPALLNQLKLLTTNTIPQTISRIKHATSPVLHEISRGYFVPFLTVALACLGRIHALLLRMGRELTSVLQETVPQLRNLCNERNKKDIVDWKILNDLVMSTFTVDTKKKSGTEWNDLMTHYVEVSQDELTMQMNDFVAEKRWSDAMSRFGLNVSTNSNSVHQIEPHGGSTFSENNNMTGDEQNVAHLPLSIDKGVNDTGELVNTSQDDVDATIQGRVSRGPVDENMARILGKGKDSSASELSRPKKKRRKKKKKGSKSSHDESSTSATEKVSKSCHAEDAKRRDEDNARSIEKDVTNRGTVYGTINPEGTSKSMKLEGELPLMIGREEGTAAEDHDGIEANYGPNISQTESEVHTDNSLEETKQTKKKPKKKQKKRVKKAKKKSSSVIDDIFGF